MQHFQEADFFPQILCHSDMSITKKARNDIKFLWFQLWEKYALKVFYYIFQGPEKSALAGGVCVREREGGRERVKGRQ